MSGRTWLMAQLDAMHQSRGGDWYYRTFAPGRTLATLDDVYVVNVDQAHRKVALIAEQADVLVVNNVCSADLLPLIVRRKQAGRLTVKPDQRRRAGVFKSPIRWPRFSNSRKISGCFGGSRPAPTRCMACRSSSVFGFA